MAAVVERHHRRQRRHRPERERQPAGVQSVAVAAPNSTAPSHALGPKWRRASGSNSTAEPVAAIAAASCGESHADTTGNSTL